MVECHTVQCGSSAQVIQEAYQLAIDVGPFRVKPNHTLEGPSRM